MKLRKEMPGLSEAQLRCINQLNMLLSEWAMDAKEGASVLGIKPEHMHEEFRPLVACNRAPSERERESIEVLMNIWKKAGRTFKSQRRFNVRNWLEKTTHQTSNQTLWEMVISGSLSNLYLVEAYLSEVLASRA